MSVRVEEIVEERIELPELPDKVPEISGRPRSGRLSRATVRGLIAAMKEHLDQDPFVVEAFVLAEVAGLPVLLVGPHGSGKTTMVKTLASALRMDGRPIAFKPVTVKEAHTEFMVFARPDFGALARGEEKWVPKLIEAEFAFIDEIFRNHRIMAALNEILEEKQFEGLPLKWLFFAAATNPPNSYYKTVDLLNYADLDRFAVIIEVEDSGLGFADRMAQGFEPELGVEVDVTDIERVRAEIASTPISPRALVLAKVLVAAFSVCGFEDVNSRARCRIYNKFAVVGELPCYRCVHQRHPICSRYAVAPKRAFRSLVHLARARAWVLGREASEEDVWWAFRFAVPGRAAVISPEVRERCPTYGALYRQMVEDFRSWWSDSSRAIPQPYGRDNDPIVPVVREFIKPVREVVGYRVVLPEDRADRLMKWFVLRKGVSTERAAAMLQKLRSRIAVSEAGLTVSPAPGGVLAVEAFRDRREAEELCGFLSG